MILDTRLGNTPRWWLTPPKDGKMRVPDQVRESVVFVGRLIAYGTEERQRPLGTAFFVSVPSEAFPDVTYLYLVTARHVAKGLSLGGPWFLRFNVTGGGIGQATAEDGKGWWYHPTEPEAVDAAVHEVIVSPGMDFKHVPVSIFATEEVIQGHDIGPGDMVFITGLFTKMSGRRRNIPIVRTGNVAMLPPERIPGIEIDTGKPVESEVYLVEARSIGGLSGSPVFVRETIYFPLDLPDPGKEDQSAKRVEMMQGPGAFFLLGLMHGHWDIREQDLNEIEILTGGEGKQGVNLGIAVVVPAKKIWEVLNQRALVELRRQQDEERRAKEGTTTSDLGG
jgi:hypothetical protein